MPDSLRWFLRNALMVASLGMLGIASVLHVRWHPIAVGRPPAALKFPHLPSLPITVDGGDRGHCWGWREITSAGTERRCI